MIRIIGENVIEQSKAFNDVRDSLVFDRDIYLGAMWAKPLGIILKNEIIYNMEYLYDKNPIFDYGYLETLKNNHVIDFSVSNVKYLNKLGIDAFYMPYGYHESLTRVKESKKDIDVLFIGSTHFKRRKYILSKLKNVVVADCYGKELDALVGRSKVHLNMHHEDGQPLETVRLNYLMANNCNIVSEYGSDEDLNKEYENGIFFSDYGELITSINFAMNNKKNSFKTIKDMKQNCKYANEWANNK